MDRIVVGGVVVRADALTVRFARSSGPGGQNANKVASKVDLRVDLSRIDGLTRPAPVRGPQQESRAGTASYRDTTSAPRLTAHRVVVVHMGRFDCALGAS